MRISFLFGAIVILFTLSAPFGMAQKSNPLPANEGSNLLASLPAADAVALIKVKRVLDEAMPKLLAPNPAKLAEANAAIEKFKISTGLDPRLFDQIALGLSYTYPREGITKVRTVGLASGSFSAGAIVAAGRIATNGKYEEQKYQGKTIYLFSLEQQLKVLGLFELQLSKLAVSPLDNHTLALGDIDGVRRVIDASKHRGRVNTELIALASRDPNAIVGFGGNIPPALIRNLRVTNDAIARDLTAVRQVYGSVGLSDRNFELLVAARTVDEYAARNLGNTVEALKQFGALFINRLPAAKSALARSALGNLKVTNQGNELQIRTAVAQADIAPLVGRN
ncbi:MAG TPA: hypothetical protein VJ124_12230 [Pyrinomonadaceae bacterium]|nr:hypothetical protein [Pyrinomonadaceae bacterium]